MARPSSRRRVTFGPAFVLVVLVTAVCAGQDGNDTDWQSQALDVGISEADVQQLATDRILITNQSYKQIYEAYPNTWGPSFITSDSLLNAYHVLYEESILRLEQAGTRQLPEILTFIMANLDARLRRGRGPGGTGRRGPTASRHRPGHGSGTARRRVCARRRGGHGHH